MLLRFFAFRFASSYYIFFAATGSFSGRVLFVFEFKKRKRVREKRERKKTPSLRATTKENENDKTNVFQYESFFFYIPISTSSIDFTVCERARKSRDLPLIYRKPSHEAKVPATPLIPDDEGAAATAVASPAFTAAPLLLLTLPAPLPPASSSMSLAGVAGGASEQQAPAGASSSQR